MSLREILLSPSFLLGSDAFGLVKVFDSHIRLTQTKKPRTHEFAAASYKSIRARSLQSPQTCVGQTAQYLQFQGKTAVPGRPGH